MALIHQWLLNETSGTNVANNINGSFDGTTVDTIVAGTVPDVGGGAPSASKAFTDPGDAGEAFDTSNINFAIGAPFGITWWFTGHGETDLQLACSHQTSANNRTGYGTTADTLHVRLAGQIFNYDFSSVVSRAVWHFVSIVRDDADLITARVNLVSIGSYTDTNTVVFNRFGSGSDGVNDLNGDWADVRIYDHALTLAQQSEIYVGGGGLVSSAGLGLGLSL